MALRFCPVCHRSDTIMVDGVERAKYPPTNQAMLPLVFNGQIVLPHEYGVCDDCHAAQYKQFYEIEAIKNPGSTVPSPLAGLYDSGSETEVQQVGPV